MEFIGNFYGIFVVLFLYFSFAVLFGSLCDYCKYKSKHGRRGEEIGMLFVPPAVAFSFTGFKMFIFLFTKFADRDFIFEQWWCAVSFVALGVWSFKKARLLEDKTEEKTDGKK